MENGSQFNESQKDAENSFSANDSSAVQKTTNNQSLPAVPEIPRETPNSTWERERKNFREQIEDLQTQITKLQNQNQNQTINPTINKYNQPAQNVSWKVQQIKKEWGLN